MTDSNLIFTKVCNSEKNMTEIFKTLFSKINRNKKSYLLIGHGHPFYHKRLRKVLGSEAYIISVEDESFRYSWKCLTEGEDVFFIDMKDINQLKSILIHILTKLNKIIKMKKFDYIIMNPPFKKAGDIWDNSREEASEVVCLGPISMYKRNKRYKYILNPTKVNPKLFKDASITENLCITVSSDTPSNREYSDLEFMTYDENYYDYYKTIKDSKETCLVIVNTSRSTEIDVSVTFATTHRAGEHGVHKTNNAWDRVWNLNRENGLPSLDMIPGKNHKIYRALFIIFSSPKAHSNFCKWWYSNNGNNLANSVAKGLHKDGTVKESIPQIDWEAISDHPLWIEGKYDEAVLDTMGLKWNETKTGVVKK